MIEIDLELSGRSWKCINVGNQYGLEQRVKVGILGLDELKGFRIISF